MDNPRVVVDLGNSRLKWANLDHRPSSSSPASLPVDEPTAWAKSWDGLGLGDPSASTWAISSVNPPVAERLERFLGERGVRQFRWYRSAADVPVRHALETPESTGTDRALAIAGVLQLVPTPRPFLVVLCGTAVTVERVDAQGVWLGGAITVGLVLSARALHTRTAQLPDVAVTEEPPPWGASTRPALEAGIYWGVVGAIRELLDRQSIGIGGDPTVFWTGGDAPLLASSFDGPKANVLPNLVLSGLAAVAFGAGRRDHAG